MIFNSILFHKCNSVLARFFCVERTGYRINKILTALSRRGADAAVASGRVKINGQVAVIGEKVFPGDDVSLDGWTVEWEAKINSRLLGVQSSSDVYYKYWKPLGVVCTTAPSESRSIIDASGLRHGGHRIVPVGRLDLDSTGLILLTSDTRLVGALANPQSGISKTYQVTLNRSPTDDELEQLTDGVEISTTVRRGRGSFPKEFQAVTRRCEVYRLSQSDSSQVHPDLFARTIMMTLHEGRNRQIRLMAQQLGMHVTHLHRVAFAGIDLSGIEGAGGRCALSGAEMALISKYLDIP